MEHTISAISTPIGIGGIAVIRISGSQAFSVAAKMFRSKTAFEKILSHTVTYGKIVDEFENTVDRVLILKMKAPKTYTKEDVVEIHCHGGMYVAQRILELSYMHGAKAALPGEFTKRAFINGQMDLMEAEAVMDLISAEAEDSYKQALSQLQGEKSLRIKQIRNDLVEIAAHLLAIMDYPEYDIDKLSIDEAKEKIRAINDKLSLFITQYDKRRIIQEGIKVAIAGDVNVGKSTFINAACGQNRVIVTDIAGTTRDLVEVKIDIEGMCVILQDTAGIRSTEDVIEKIGIEKSIQAIEEADAVVFITDINQEHKDELFRYIKDLDKTICVLNKTDLIEKENKQEYIQQREQELASVFKNRIVASSLDKKEGIDEIFDALFEMLEIGKIRPSSPAITNSRHKMHLVDAMNCLYNVEQGVYPDMISVDLDCAIDNLGKITGESAEADIIDTIFQNFCVGK